MEGYGGDSTDSRQEPVAVISIRCVYMKETDECLDTREEKSWSHIKGKDVHNHVRLSFLI